MKQLELKPGTAINQNIVITGIYYHDLFSFSYQAGENLMSQKDIQHEIIAPKEELIKKLTTLFFANTELALKYLNKKMLSTKSIPLINSLNEVLESLKESMSSIENKENFTFYERMTIKRLLQLFWFRYLIG